LRLAGAVEVNALTQGALRQFTHWPRIEHSTFQLRGECCTAEWAIASPVVNKVLCDDWTLCPTS